MDKYEFNIKVEQIKKLVGKNDYETAMKIADTIDWRRVRNTNLLSMVAMVYEKNEDYQEAKEILLQAFERAPIGKRLLYKLAELAIKEGNIEEAEAYYKEFGDLASEDPRQQLLRYMILKSKGAPAQQLIHSLESYISVELDEKWLYELAELYSLAGMPDRCVETCDRIMLMFGLGKYVDKAMDLKIQYAPLTNYQMDLVENRDKYEAKLRAVEQEYRSGRPLDEEPEEEYYDEEPASEESDLMYQENSVTSDIEASMQVADVQETLAREMSRISYDEPMIQEESRMEHTRVLEDIRRVGRPMTSIKRPRGVYIPEEEETMESYSEPVIEEEEMVDPGLNESAMDRYNEPESEYDNYSKGNGFAVNNHYAKGNVYANNNAYAGSVDPEENGIYAGGVDRAENDVYAEDNDRAEKSVYAEEDEHAENGAYLEDDNYAESNDHVENNAYAENGVCTEDNSYAENDVYAEENGNTENDAYAGDNIYSADYDKESSDDYHNPEYAARQAAITAEDLQEYAAQPEIPYKLHAFADEALQESAGGIHNTSKFIREDELEFEDLYEEEDELEEIPVRNHLMIEARTPEKGLQIAVEALKQIHKENGVKNPVAKITGSKLSKRGVMSCADKLAGKDLVIEEAGDLTPAALNELNVLMEHDDSGMIVVLIDNPKQMETLHQEHPILASKFECIGSGEAAASPTQHQFPAYKNQLLREEPYDSYGNSASYQPESYAEDEQHNGYQEQGYDHNNGYAPERAYDRESKYRQNNAYHQDNTYNRADIHDQEGTYNRADIRDQESTYSQADKYGRESSYSHADTYDQEDSYSQENAYDQEGSHNQNNANRKEAAPKRKKFFQSNRKIQQEESSQPGKDYQQNDPYQSGNGYAPATASHNEEMDLDEFAQYACRYANEIDCSITGKSMLALYERIEIMEEDGIPLSRANAESLIEEAADRAEKPTIGKRIKSLFSTKYDKDGLLVLKEEHFIY